MQPSKKLAFAESTSRNFKLRFWFRHNMRCAHVSLHRKQTAKLYLAICFSLISSRVLQSMHRVAVGLASRRLRPISTPQLSQ